jgi:hypothetical protein
LECPAREKNGQAGTHEKYNMAVQGGKAREEAKTGAANLLPR